LRDVSLAQAREKAAAMRALLAQGQDPGAVPQAAETLKTPTFGEFADALLADIETEWRNEKHRGQWARTLTIVAAPLRPIPIDQVDTADILAALKPLWRESPETASRARGRIERVLSAARAKGHIVGPWTNPAIWRGHLDQLLPARRALDKGHHAAMPYAELPAFMRMLAEQKGVSPKALMFTILTASRTSEVLGAVWSEIDLENALWSIPAERMKAGRAHRVPLSEAALAILKDMARLRGSTTLRPEGASGATHVFPGSKPNQGLSAMSLAMTLHRTGKAWGEGGITVHGFRSTFRDWAAEQTSFSHDICEMALAHRTGNAVSLAYKRSDMVDLRRPLMQAWARFCGGGAEIISLVRDAG
jgi:integrase